MKKCVITGAAGFFGTVLVGQLIKRGVEVFCVVRKKSPHNVRLNMWQSGLHLIECELDSISDLHRIALENGCDCRDMDCFFHLAWAEGRSCNDQRKNTDYTIAAVEAAAECNCTRFICTGSQAEYGIVPSDTLITEKLPCSPLSAYGAAKLAACQLSKICAKELEIEWVWARIFSLIGKYEPRGRMLPDLYRWLCLQQEVKGERRFEEIDGGSGADNEGFFLSSCRQNWDYLDVYDAADALIALAERGQDGEIYNVANGAYRPLKEYTEEMRKLVASDAKIPYGDDPDPFISLQPSVEKIYEHTGWRAKRSFAESVKDYEEMM